jgi:hypothetical protein
MDKPRDALVFKVPLGEVAGTRGSSPDNPITLSGGMAWFRCGTCREEFREQSLLGDHHKEVGH